MAASTSSGGGVGQPRIDQQLLKAAMAGDDDFLDNFLTSLGGDDLHRTTSQGNTCLHISCKHGHLRFSQKVYLREMSLLNAVNNYAQTPLLIAIISGHVSIASSLLLHCSSCNELCEAILMQDITGSNALHYAISNGYKELAIDLINKVPNLTFDVNNLKESPMYISLMRKNTDHHWIDVFNKILEISEFSDSAPCGYSVLHIAVTINDISIVQKLLDVRSTLAGKKGTDGMTPIQLAVIHNKVEVVRLLLSHDYSLGYIVTEQTNYTLLHLAAQQNLVEVASVLVKMCPDVPYYTQSDQKTCLHEAAFLGNMEFVEFILQSHLRHEVLSMQTRTGQSALHYAVKGCHPNMVQALINHGINVTIMDNNAKTALWELMSCTSIARTIKWNLVSMVLLQADPQNATAVDNLYKDVKEKLADQLMDEAKMEVKTFKEYASAVGSAALALVFAVLFSFPGEATSKPRPIMKIPSFSAFLFFDLLSLFSSSAALFICFLTRLDEPEFLRHMKPIIKHLLFFSYISVLEALACGLYIPLVYELPALAVAICILAYVVPTFIEFFCDWHLLKLRYRFRGSYRTGLLVVP